MVSEKFVLKMCINSGESVYSLHMPQDHNVSVTSVWFTGVSIIVSGSQCHSVSVSGRRRNFENDIGIGDANQSSTRNPP